MALIYVVEDDVNIQEIEMFALKNSGYRVEGFGNAKDFFAKLSEKTPDLILLDVMLPDLDGLSILKKVRTVPDTKKIPVIFVSAKTSEMDKVKGLDMGADDYLGQTVWRDGTDLPCESTASKEQCSKRRKDAGTGRNSD